MKFSLKDLGRVVWMVVPDIDEGVVKFDIEQGVLKAIGDFDNPYLVHVEGCEWVGNDETILKTEKKARKRRKMLIEQRNRRMQGVLNYYKQKEEGEV